MTTTPALNDDLVRELNERAASYRLGGPSSEHTAALLEHAAEEIEALRAALEPFAARAGKLDGKWLDHETHWSPAYGSTAITIGDLRRARTALTGALNHG